MMLMSLRSQMKEGDRVPITLVVEGAHKKRQTLDVQAQVRPLNASGVGTGSRRKH